MVGKRRLDGIRGIDVCFGHFSQIFDGTVGCQSVHRACEKLQVFSGLEGYYRALQAWFGDRISVTCHFRLEIMPEMSREQIPNCY